MNTLYTSFGLFTQIRKGGEKMENEKNISNKNIIHSMNKKERTIIWALIIILVGLWLIPENFQYKITIIIVAVLIISPIAYTNTWKKLKKKVGL